jgi:hypothetical protein
MVAPWPFFIGKIFVQKGGGFTHWVVIVANILYPSRSSSGNQVKAFLISFSALIFSVGETGITAKQGIPCRISLFITFQSQNVLVACGTCRGLPLCAQSLKQE